MLEKFRQVRDQIEAKIRHWLEHPEEELATLQEERERERQQRMRALHQEDGRHAPASATAEREGISMRVVSA